MEVGQVALGERQAFAITTVFEWTADPTDQAVCLIDAPRRVVFSAEYPTTATGKIRRAELREQATACWKTALGRGGGLNSGPNASPSGL